MKKKEEYEIVLVFPPIWLPETPYLSLPALSAYLKSKGYFPIQMDLNIEFWKHFYHEERLKDMYKWSKEIFHKLKKEGVHYFSEKEQIDFLIRFRMMFLELDKCSQTRKILDFKSMPFPLEDEFLEKVKKVEKSKFRNLCELYWRNAFMDNKIKKIPDYQWQSHIKYHDYFFTNISLCHYALSTQGILKIVDDIELNPYIHYFRKNNLTSIVAKKPDLVGISIVALNQVVPAFTLAKLLKESLPELHIVLGGPWCTHLHDVLPQKDLLFKWIDSIVVFEGERPIFELSESLRQMKDLNTVPNLIYKDIKTIRVNQAVHNHDLNSLPTPDFSDLPLTDYEFNGTFSIQASRGCSWGKCDFCSYPVIDPVYRGRDAELVVEDMNTLMEKFNAKEFNFTDSVLEPNQIFQISDLMFKKELKTKWRGFARFDTHLTPKILKTMAKSGCHEIIWGLESGCQRILNLITKGSSLSVILRILKESTKANIHNRACIIYGFPTETMEDVKTTIKFIEDNMHYIQSLAYSYLTLEWNTPMVRNPEKFFLILDDIPDNDLEIGFNHRSMLNLEELELLDNELTELCVRIERLHERLIK